MRVSVLSVVSAAPSQQRRAGGGAQRGQFGARIGAARTGGEVMSHGRRAVLKAALGLGLWFSCLDGVPARADDARTARPQEGDRFVFPFGDTKRSPSCGRAVLASSARAGTPSRHENQSPRPSAAFNTARRPWDITSPPVLAAPIRAPNWPL